MKLKNIIAVAVVITSCSAPWKEVRPAIDEYLLEEISNPDTYEPGKTEYLGEARMQRDPLAEFPTGDTLDVRVFVHHFKHKGRDGEPRDVTWYFYFTQDGQIAMSHIGDEPLEEGLIWK